MSDYFLWNLWEYLVNLFDCGMAVFLFQKMMTPKYKNKWIPCVFCVFSAGLLLLINHMTTNLIGVFIFTFVFVIYNCIAMSDQIGYKIFWPFYCVIIYNVIDSLSSTLLQIVASSLTMRALLFPIASEGRFLNMVISRLLIASAIILTSRKKFLPMNLKPSVWCILSGILICSGVSITMLINYIHQYNISNTSLFFVVFSVLLVAILSFAVLKIFSKQTAQIAMLQVKSAQVEMAKNQAEQAVSAYHSLRKWKHDFHNHVAAINQLAMKEQSVKIKEYTDSLEDHFDSECMLISTENIYIDAIINAKLLLAKMNRIGMNLKLEIPDLDQIDHFDICSLIGNIIDNAIEANKKIVNPSERYINFGIHFSSPFCVIHCDNAMAEPPKRENGHIISSKPGTGHGLGIMLIKDITKKYAGIYQYQDDLNIFMIDVMLPVSPIQTSLQLICYNQKEELS